MSPVEGQIQSVPLTVKVTHIPPPILQFFLLPTGVKRGTVDKLDVMMKPVPPRKALRAAPEPQPIENTVNITRNHQWQYACFK